MKYYLFFVAALLSFGTIHTVQAEKVSDLNTEITKLEAETAKRFLCNSDEIMRESDASKLAPVICEVSGGGSDGGSDGNNNNLNQTIVQCESWNYDTEICSLPSGAISAVMIQQISETNCSGKWSLSNNSVIAYNGCRAKFKVTFNRNLNVVTTQCDSWGYSYAPCGVPIAGNSTIWLQSRQSNSACKRNSSWGYNGALWVDNGCRGTFASAW